MPDVVCIGQAVVDIFVKGIQDEMQEDLYRQCESVTLEIGGDSTNESRILKRLGVDVSVVHGRGNDSAGKFMELLFEEDGVDLSRALVLPDFDTKVVSILLSENGERNIISSLGNTNFGDFKIVPSMIEGAKIVSFASLFFDPLKDPETVIEASKMIKESGALLCADTNGAASIDISDYAEAFKYFDYVFPNDIEAMTYSNTTTVRDAADFFLNMGVKNVIIKTGKEGCFFKNADKELYVKSFPVENVVDATGAGDNFAAGFICSLLDGRELYDALRFACATASIAIQTVGASTGVRNKQQVLDVIAAAD